MPQRRVVARDVNTNIPFTRAVAVLQPTSAATRLSGSDIISYITFTPTSSLSQVLKYQIAPSYYPSTRLGNLSMNFQKYRFLPGSHFKMYTNQPTTVGGSMVVGYTSNPDQRFSTISPASSVYTLDGAHIMQFYVPMDIPLQITDRAKWYNIDIDSSEIMNTTAGSLVIALQQVPTSSITFPIIFNWNIEFIGKATQLAVLSPPQPFGPITITTPTGTLNTFTYAAGAATPSLIFNTPYICNPEPNVLVDDAASELVEARIVVFTSATTARFYISNVTYDQGAPLTLQLGTAGRVQYNTLSAFTVTIL